MLHEILLSLLGFTGEVIICDGSTFKVQPGFDKLSQAEIEQINSLVPLGWFYVHLNAYVSKHEPSWSNASRVQVYKAAVGVGVSDLLEEYAAAVAALEQAVLLEGPVTLNYVLQYLQKFLLVLPVVFAIATRIDPDVHPLREAGGVTGAADNLRLPPTHGRVPALHGTQILEYLMSYRTGVVVVGDAVARILGHVQLVFCRQLLSWMLFGELSEAEKEIDESGAVGGDGSEAMNTGPEFFVQVQQTHQVRGAASRSTEKGKVDSLMGAVASRLTNARKQQQRQSECGAVPSASGSTIVGAGSSFGSGDSAPLPFDWNSTYVIRYSMVPNSMLLASAGLASKVLFAGKAVKLLSYTSRMRGRSNDRAGGDKDYSSTAASAREAVRMYFMSAGNAAIKTSAGPVTGVANSAASSPASKSAAKDEVDVDNGPDISLLAAFRKHATHCGYSAKDVERFARRYSDLCTVILHAAGIPGSADAAGGGASSSSSSNAAHVVTELLSHFIDDVHDTVSAQLWKLLRDEMAFPAHMQTMRNTYLLGKGEFYQLIFDGLLGVIEGDDEGNGGKTSTTGRQWWSRIAGDASGAEGGSGSGYGPLTVVGTADALLNARVVKSAAKLLSLDDDLFSSVFRLRANRNNIVLNGSSMHSGNVEETSQSQPANSGFYVGTGNTGVSAKALTLVGSATVRTRTTSTVTPGGDKATNTTSSVSLLSPTQKNDSMMGIAALWRECLGSEHESDKNSNTENKGMGERTSDKEIGANSVSRTAYAHGGCWLSDQKMLSRGVRVTASVYYDWHSATDGGGSATASHYLLTPSHPLMRRLVPCSSAPVDFGSGVGGSTGRSAISSSSSLLLGSTSVVIHNDRQGSRLFPSQDDQLLGEGAGELGVEPTATGISYIRGSISVKTSLHAYLLKRKVDGAASVKVAFFVKLALIAVPDDTAAALHGGTPLPTSPLSSHNEAGSAGYTLLTETCYDVRLPSERTHSADEDRFLIAGDVWTIDVEYNRVMGKSQQAGSGDTASVASETPSKLSVRTSASAVGAGIKFYLCAKITSSSVNGDGQNRPSDSSSIAGPNVGSGGVGGWDAVAAVDIGAVVRLQGGGAIVGMLGSSLISNRVSKAADSGALLLKLHLLQLKLSSRSILSTYPVASTALSAAKHPETYHRVASLVSQFHAWMQLKLEYAFPPLFSVILDATALIAYQRLFTLLMKVRLVVHALERLWKIRDSSGDPRTGNINTNTSISTVNALTYNRSFCWIRHSMHFFVSHLFYYFQIDVIDAEFAEFTSAMEREDADFATVVRVHRNFLSNVLRHSMMDHSVIQDGIEGILHLCLRFLALCRLLLQEDGDVDEGEGGVVPTITVVPPEELDALRDEFVTQVSYLVQMMRKVDNINKGFLLRLDFNGFLSDLAAQQQKQRVLQQQLSQQRKQHLTLSSKR